MKRALDVFVALIGLAVLSPLFLLIAVVILSSSGGPVYFLQERVGLLGKPFRIIKFRTMVRDAYTLSGGRIVGEDSQLITKSGRFLRRWSLDELPELVNVLKGDMSLVGPRPTLPEQVAAYDPFQRRRLEVRPGITGWAQVNGRMSMDWAHRIPLDVWYVEHRSLWLDLRILVRTVDVVTRHADVYYMGASHKDSVADDSETPSGLHRKT
jgi:lipopolysaccharide/colanic/teichoic acid biosynthesis glycosyltransferase